MTTTPSHRRQHRSISEWHDIFARHRDSGLSAAAFCKREAICEGSFYHWRTQLVGGADIQRAQPPSSTPAFVDLEPLVTAPASSDGRIELRLDLGAGIVLTLVRG